MLQAYPATAPTSAPSAVRTGKDVDMDTRTLHPCPICGTDTSGGPRYPRAVCRDCAVRATDRGGRRIVGVNTSLSGGFEARYRTSDSYDGDICTEVTQDGRCWIDGRPCSIGEARFGGVVIQA